MCLDAEKRNIYVFGGQTLFLNLIGEDRPTAGEFTVQLNLIKKFFYKIFVSINNSAVFQLFLVPEL